MKIEIRPEIGIPMCNCAAEEKFSMIQSKPPVTRWCNNLSLAGKRPVRIKLPLTQIQYLREVPGFRSAARQRVTYFYCIAAFEALFKGSPGTVKAALTL